MFVSQKLLTRIFSRFLSFYRILYRYYEQTKMIYFFSKLYDIYRYKADTYIYVCVCNFSILLTSTFTFHLHLHLYYFSAMIYKYSRLTIKNNSLQNRPLRHVRNALTRAHVRLRSN